MHLEFFCLFGELSPQHAGDGSKKEVMVYYSVKKAKAKEILKFACKCTELDEVILSEETQIQKDKLGMYSLMRGF